MKPNSVKQKLALGAPCFGTWVTICSNPKFLNILATSTLDFVIIEMEHSDFSIETVSTLCNLSRALGIIPFVRPPGTSKSHDLTRPLDCGAQGLLLPSIDDADTLVRIIQETKYWPIGKRPMNLRGVHTDYERGSPREMISHLNENSMIVAMIESQTAMSNLEEICKTPGLDAIFVGPDDLSQDLGVPGDLTNSILVDAIEEIFRIASENKIPFGASAQRFEQLENRVKQGATWIPFKNDASIYLDAMQDIRGNLEKLRS